MTLVVDIFAEFFSESLGEPAGMALGGMDSASVGRRGALVEI